MKLWCCHCKKDIEARLTNGAEVYPHRTDLADLPRWICDVCKNHVGTHYKTATPTKPLGNIPSSEIKRARIALHDLIDPVWKSGAVSRGNIYTLISKQLGYQYHTGELKTLDEARHVYKVAQQIINESMKQ
jgi:hypothetical protein